MECHINLIFSWWSALSLCWYYCFRCYYYYQRCSCKFNASHNSLLSIIVIQAGIYVWQLNLKCLCIKRSSGTESVCRVFSVSMAFCAKQFEFLHPCCHCIYARICSMSVHVCAYFYSTHINYTVDARARAGLTLKNRSSICTDASITFHLQ